MNIPIIGGSYSRRNKFILIVLIASVICWGLTYLLYNHFFQSEARFKNWKLLGSPSEPITKIVGISFNGVIVQTTSQKNYLGILDSVSGRVYWPETNTQPRLPNETCGKKDVVENAIQVVQICGTMHGFADVITVYALQKDGNVYVKEKVEITDEGMNLFIYIAILEGIVGFFFFTVIYLVFIGDSDERAQARAE